MSSMDLGIFEKPKLTIELAEYLELKRVIKALEKDSDEDLLSVYKQAFNLLLPLTVKIPGFNLPDLTRALQNGYDQRSKIKKTIKISEDLNENQILIEFEDEQQEQDNQLS